MPLPSTGLSQSDLRRRLRGSDAAATRDSGPIPKLDAALKRSGQIPRLGDPSNRTPLPGDLTIPVSEVDQLRSENTELRSLIEQAISQEEENERKARAWLAQMEDRDRIIVDLQEQVDRFDGRIFVWIRRQVEHGSEQGRRKAPAPAKPQRRHHDGQEEQVAENLPHERQAPQGRQIGGQDAR